MKKSIVISSVVITIIALVAFKPNEPVYKDGDIIFQTTSGDVGKAIQIASHSQYNHCGMLFYENGIWMVYEAVQPVSKITLKNFNKRGKGVVYRLKNRDAVLTTDAIVKLKATYAVFNNKNYDDKYMWSDTEIYCSELVYKLYKNALNIEVCTLKKLSDYDLSNPLVKEKLKEKYNGKIPLQETIVAPSDIANSSMVELVN